MLKEKNIYHSWKKRFSYPISSHENVSARFFGKIKKTSLITTKDVYELIRKSRVVFLGDDALVTQQKEMIQELISKLGSRILLVTNRNGQDSETKFIFDKIRKKNGFVQIVRNQNTNRQNLDMYKKVKAGLLKYDQVVVWTGHLRISSFSFQKLFSQFEPAYVYLQCNELRWKFPKQRGWKKIGNNQLTWLDHSPLLSLDYFRAAQETDAVLLSPEDIPVMFDQTMKILSKTLGQENYLPPKKIIHVFENQKIQEINKLKNKKDFFRFLKERIFRGESAVIPSQRAVLLSTTISSHIVEEAAHYLRTSHRRYAQYGRMGIVVEEALAFFSSLLIFPNRPIPKLFTKKTAWDEVHLMGYSIGFRLWKVWKRSKKSRAMIRKLWNTYPENEKESGSLLSVMLELK